jgi:hypothetical protein
MADKKKESGERAHYIGTSKKKEARPEPLSEVNIQGEAENEKGWVSFLFFNKILNASLGHPEVQAEGGKDPEALEGKDPEALEGSGVGESRLVFYKTQKHNPTT